MSIIHLKFALIVFILCFIVQELNRTIKNIHIIEIRRAKIRQCGPWKFTAWNFNWLVCFNDKRKNTSAIFSGNLIDISTN